MSEIEAKVLIDEMSDKYDKRPGNLVYDFMVPISTALSALQEKIELVESKLDVTKLKGKELDLFITQNSDKTRHEATHSVVSVTVIGDCNISKGDLTETSSGIQFEFLDDITINASADVIVKALIAGVSGNVRANTITQMPRTLQGLISINNPSDAIDGFDQETDEHFLNRFLESEQTEETQGNKAQHKAWAKSVQGVGEAKVFPLQNISGESTDNSVLTIIVDSNILPASEELINTVQSALNPLDENGHGSGLAPLGCYAYIKSATGLELNITFDAVLSEGITNEVATISTSEKIKEFLRQAYKENKIISIAQLGAVILSVVEIDDYSNLKINGNILNVTVPEKSVAILKSVVIS